MLYGYFYGGKHMKIIMLGAPGAGKRDTGKEKLLKSNSIPHISTGDIFRANIKKRNRAWKESKDIYGSGTFSAG